MTLTDLICENTGQELPLQQRSLCRSELEAIASIYLKLKLLTHPLSPEQIDASLHRSEYVNLVIADNQKN